MALPRGILPKINIHNLRRCRLPCNSWGSLYWARLKRVWSTVCSPCGDMEGLGVRWFTLDHLQAEGMPGFIPSMRYLAVFNSHTEANKKCLASYRTGLRKTSSFPDLIHSTHGYVYTRSGGMLRSMYQYIEKTTSQILKGQTNAEGL